MRKVILLGASGSIGTQTLDVMRKNPADFTLVAFSVGSKTRKIAHIINMYPDVKAICIKDKNKVNYYQSKYPNISIYSGDEELLKLIDTDGDMVVNALVGFVGLKPTLYALEKNKTVCLANKEALVVGGELVNDLLNKGYGKLYPIDSEHSAIKKCLMVDSSNVSKVMLTASGGAFRKLNRDQLKDVKAEDALKHPTWKMGNKITIDCATMINKAFEVIEAHYLFGCPYNQIGIKLHDESMIHSYVVYKDGSMRLDLSKPDMRNPIKLALYEFNTEFKTIIANSLDQFKDLHFHDFTFERYPIVKLAKYVINEKGTYGAVFNASNEVAVNAFLKDQIPFLAIEEIVNVLMKKHQNIVHPTYEQIAEVDKNTRKKTYELIKKWRKD
ncbi:MAG: 1-deoxy-D-xylulose-5-phosphate reductoisomerase [Bacilli bacterium]|nr:1-deoxy-D-xylulose-5-phosphate reductoisomerase [Bacilli bacterium]